MDGCNLAFALPWLRQEVFYTLGYRNQSNTNSDTEIEVVARCCPAREPGANVDKLRVRLHSFRRVQGQLEMCG